MLLMYYEQEEYWVSSLDKLQRKQNRNGPGPGTMEKCKHPYKALCIMRLSFGHVTTVTKKKRQKDEKKMINSFQTWCEGEALQKE